MKGGEIMWRRNASIATWALALCCLTALFLRADDPTNAAPTAQPTADSRAVMASSLKWQTGTITLKDGLAKINLTDGERTRTAAAALVCIWMMSSPAYATDWWLYMASVDKCIAAAPVANALGDFAASPEALIKQYRSQGLHPTQHRIDEGKVVAVDAGDGSGQTMFFSSSNGCEIFKLLNKSRN